MALIARPLWALCALLLTVPCTQTHRILTLSAVARDPAAAAFAYPRLRGPFEPKARPQFQELRGGSDRAAQDESPDVINDLVDRVQRMKTTAGVSAHDDLIIGYQVRITRTSSCACVKNIAGPPSSVLTFNLQVVGGQQEHTDVARALMSAHEAAITGALGFPLQELPSIYSYFSSMLKDEERVDGETAEPSSHHGAPKVPISGQTGAAGNVVLSFSVHCASTSPGESVGIVGGCAELGLWSEASVVAMDPTDWPVWKLSLPLSASSCDVEYKYIKFLPEGGRVTEWEAGSNRKVSLAPGMTVLAIDNGAFGSADAAVEDLSPPAAAATPGEVPGRAKADDAGSDAQQGASGGTAESADGKAASAGAAGTVAVDGGAPPSQPFFASSITRMQSMEDLWKDAGGTGEVVGETVEEVIIGGLVVSLRIRIAKVKIPKSPDAPPAPREALSPPPESPTPSAAAPAPAPLAPSTPIPPSLPAQTVASTAEPAAALATPAAGDAEASQAVRQPRIVASAAAVAAEVQEVAKMALAAAAAMDVRAGEAGGARQGGVGGAADVAEESEAAGKMGVL